MILETTQTIPLEVWEDGTIRVKGTRLLIDMIINEYKSGAIPEEIVDSFPSVEVAEVYAIIAYYLTHKEQVEKYLEKQENEAAEVRKLIESMPNYHEKRNQLRETLLNRWKNRK